MFTFVDEIEYELKHLYTMTTPKSTKREDVEPIELDETDKRIVNALMDNARQSLREIAKKVKVSVATVMHRVHRLEKTGVLSHYTVSLDYEKLGFDVQVIIQLIVSKGKLFEVEKKVASHPNVSAVYDVTGEHDVLVIAKFPSRRSMDSFLKKLQTYDFVEKTKTKLVLNTIKEAPIQV